MHLAVRPQFNSRSDHHSCNGYIRFKISTIGGAGSLTSFGGDQSMGNRDGGLTSYLWRLDHPRTGAGSLTGPHGDQTTRGYFGSPKTLSFRKFLKEFLVIQTLRALRDFQNRMGRRWCSLITLDLSPTRICNLSKVATIH
jgi:hypothetical protein